MAVTIAAAASENDEAVAAPDRIRPVMTSILLVKTSSLGDVVHNLPVVTDVRRAYPGAAIDWVVEESFEAIPRLHPGVRDTIAVRLRSWRKTWWQQQTREEISAMKSRLRTTVYDAVIDTQGLLKSAWIAQAARGPRHGLDWSSSREPLAWFYDRTHRVPWTMHAVERNRELVAQALNLLRDADADYGIRCAAAAAAGPYAVLLHATSATNKLWPDAAWIEVGRALEARGLPAVLPWGNEVERDRSARLGAALPGARIPQRLTLHDAAQLLAGARLVVGLDTGLTHLAGALGVPTIGVYVATDPAATGLYACARATNLGGRGSVPGAGEVLEAAERLMAV